MVYMLFAPPQNRSHRATPVLIHFSRVTGIINGQRGITAEDAVNMIVSGFCKEVFRELPMEFAVEAQKLISISLEGSVG